MRAGEISAKKLVVFDIDDTLVHTQTKVHVIDTETGEVIDSLNSHDFTHYRLKPGEEFDFSGFRNAREFFEKSKPIIPMMRQLKQDIATGNKVVMVTARADFDDKELFLDTFRKYGIDMSKVHVYRAGNIKGGTTEERKKQIIKRLLDQDDYAKAIMYDDAKPNLHTFIELKKDHPRTRFYAWHVDPEGRASEYMREGFVREGLDPDKFEDLDAGIIARAAKKIVPSIRTKNTPEGYVHLTTEDGLNLYIGASVADGVISVNIGSGGGAASSGAHKGAVTDIIRSVYDAAVRKYGRPDTPGELTIDHDAGHGVWQHIADKLGLTYAAVQVKESGVQESSGKNVVKSVKVGNFRHDLVDTGFGWQVRIYNGDELYDSGMTKNTEQKGLAALDDSVAYTEKLTRTKRQGVEEGKKTKRKSRWAAYGPGPFGGYGFSAGYSGDGGIGEDQDQIKIYMSHDPDYMGAIMVNDYDGSELATTTLPSRSLKGFEPDSKMEDPKSAANVKKIIRGLKKGDKIPAILVRKSPSGYQVIDGHHRFWAQKKIGIHDIPVKIVPSKYIKDVKNKDEIPKEHLDEDQDLTELNVAATLKFIKDAHGDQLYGKLPYWRHPRAVAMTGRKIFGSRFNSDAVKAAFLHDVIEDTSVDLIDLKEMGFSDRVVDAVSLLTKDASLSYSENIDRIIDSGNTIAQMVKYADNYENYTSDKSGMDQKRASAMEKKYLNSLNRLGEHLGIKYHLGEASYEGNVGMMEVARFFRIATEAQKKMFKELLEKGKRGLAWKMIQDVTDTKLQGKEFKVDEGLQQRTIDKLTTMGMQGPYHKRDLVTISGQWRAILSDVSKGAQIMVQDPNDPRHSAWLAPEGGGRWMVGAETGYMIKSGPGALEQLKFLLRPIPKDANNRISSNMANI